MANKYFRSVRKSDGAESLVRAGNAKQALIAITGSADGVTPATDEQIQEHFAGEGALHEKSLPKGEGKLFFAPSGDGKKALIRAKNAATAFSLLNADAYEITQCSQDSLVEMIDKLGVKSIIEYVEPVKTPKKAADPENTSGNPEGGSSQDEAGAAPAAQEAGEAGAGANPADGAQQGLGLGEASQSELETA